MDYLLIGCIMLLLFHTTYTSEDLAHRKIFRGKVGKGCMKQNTIKTDNCVYQAEFTDKLKIHSYCGL